MGSTTIRRDRRSGSIIIWLGITLVFLIPLVGLVIDVGLAYAIKARLSGAVDAAALAGAQSFSLAQTLQAQKQRAEETATAYFNANFPAGSMATSNANFTATATPTTTFISVVMEGSLDAPLFFLRTLGFSTIRVGASGTAQRRIANIMMVLDRSYSLQQSGSCQAMVSAAQTFTTYFATGSDALGMVAFGGSYQVAYPITLNFNQSTQTSLYTKIGTISSCNDTTGTAQALWLAWKQLEALDQPGALNAIVLFTDGIPNGLTADWPIKKTATPNRPSNYNPVGDMGNGTFSIAGKSGCTTSNNTIRGNIAIQGGIDGWKTTTINQDANPVANNSSASDTMAVTQSPGDGYNRIGGCAFYNNGNYNAAIRVFQDIAYIPTADIYGNDTTGSLGATIGSVSNQILTSPDPYVGKINPYWGNTTTDNAIDNAATNAVYSAGHRIRSNTRLHPVIYTIGFGQGTEIQPGSPADTLLRAVANDPSSAFYNSAQETGKYVYVPNAGGLKNAFAQVATVLLRLAR